MDATIATRALSRRQFIRGMRAKLDSPGAKSDSTEIPDRFHTAWPPQQTSVIVWRSARNLAAVSPYL